MGDQEPFSHRKVWITFFEFITIIIIIIIIIIVVIIIINNYYCLLYRLFNLSVYDLQCLWYNFCGFASIIIPPPFKLLHGTNPKKNNEQIQTPTAFKSTLLF